MSHCTLRDVRVTNPFWTYCQNFRYGKKLPAPTETEKPEGWIFASGLYEGYVRIPWHGAAELEVSTVCVCTICGRKTDNGITLAHNGKQVGFCTDRHYIDWWKTKHEDPAISSEGLDTPEEFYKAIK